MTGLSPRWLALFDIDGTLLHSRGCGRAATELAMREVFGTTGALHRISLAGQTDRGVLADALAPHGITRPQIAARMDEYNLTVGRHLADIIAGFDVMPCPGAPALLAALRADPAVLVGLVTGNSAALVPIKLRAAGYDPAHFAVAAYGSEGWLRPELPPLALARAQTHTGVAFAPSQVIIIGDTPGDVACAASIGARTLAVATGPFSAAELLQCAPDAVFDDLRDTAAVLEIMQARDGQHT